MQRGEGCSLHGAIAVKRVSPPRSQVTTWSRPAASGIVKTGVAVSVPAWLPAESMGQGHVGAGIRVSISSQIDAQPDHGLAAMQAGGCCA